MERYWIKQSNGTYVAVVDVFVREAGSDAVAPLVVSYISETMLSALEVEDAAMNVIADQVEGEDAWGVVIGATVRPTPAMA